MPGNELTQTEPSLNPPVATMVKVTINGTVIETPKGENVIESAKRAGVDVPYFCYHPRLSKGDAANCRMCLVDVSMPGPDGSLRKMPKPQTACTLPAADGMVIETENEGLTKDRKAILEFLLINHPLDCPICDRGGECPLQNNTLFYGPETSRYIEDKRHFPKAYPLSDNVVFDRERCIHCARCTRFTEDISGDHQLGFLKRGAEMEVGTFAHTEYDSKFSGNVIELCPVGALLSRTYRFKARPWDLHSQRSICSKCSNGCNIKIDYRVNELLRINARLNEDVNEEWTCDRGKFGHEYVSSKDRLTRPLIKRDGKFMPIDWTEAYRILADQFGAAGSTVAGIGGRRCTNEDNYAFQKLFRETLKSPHLDSRLDRWQGPTEGPLFGRFGMYGMSQSIASIEKMRSIFVIGADLVEEQPILFLRVRKAWRFNETRVVSAISHEPADSTKVGDFASVELRYTPGAEQALVTGLLHALIEENLFSPDSADAVSRIKAGLHGSSAASAAHAGVEPHALKEAAAILARSPMTIIAGKAVTDSPEYSAIAGLLADLADAAGSQGAVNVPGRHVNTQGAMDMGVLPDSAPGYVKPAETGMGTHDILQAAADGRLDALWIVGAKLVEEYHDSELAARAMENCPFVVVNELFLTETAQHADMVLPAASFAEKDGTFTNCERRVQRIFKAFDVSPEIKPDWLIFQETGAQLGAGEPYFSARDILRDIEEKVAIYGGIDPKSLGDQGVRWEHSAGA